ELGQEALPIEFAALVVFLEHALRRVAGERDRAVFRGEIQENAELECALILTFVDEEMRELERRVIRTRERAANDLPDAEQNRHVLGVDRGKLPVPFAF